MESSQGQGLVFYSVLNIPPPQGGMCTRRHLAHSPDCLPQQGCHPWGANLGPNASWGLFGVGIEEDKRTVVSSAPGCYRGPPRERSPAPPPLLPSLSLGGWLGLGRARLLHCLCMGFCILPQSACFAKRRKTVRWSRTNKPRPL